MAMKRINITIDQELYEKARAVCFLKKTSLSEFFRESVIKNIAPDIDNKATELLSAKDEKEILALINSPDKQESMTHQAIKKNIS